MMAAKFTILFVLIFGIFSVRNLLGINYWRQVEISDANPSRDDVRRLVGDD